MSEQQLYDKTYFKKIFDQEEFKAEKNINKINLILTSVFFAVVIINGLLSEFYNTIPNLIGSSIAIIYNIVLLFILKKGKYFFYLKYITSSIYTSIIITTIYGYSFDSSWVHTLRTSNTTSLLIPIFLSCFYKNPKLPVFATTLTIILYWTLFFFANASGTLNLVKTETFTENAVSVAQIVFVSMLMIIGGLISLFLALNFRSIYKGMLDSKTEAYSSKQFSELKTNFFINLAHETKTPLTLIKNYLEKYINEVGWTPDLRVIYHNFEKLQRDMVNYLDTEKLQKGKLNYDHSQTMNFSQLLNNQIKLFTHSAKLKQITLKNQITPDCRTRVDHSAAERIINNLIENAIRYTPECGLITVSLFKNQQQLVFAVEDNGMGMDKESQKKLFTPFYQSTHNKRNIQGIGMGLSIVSLILEQIKAAINLQSEPGKGSCFTITMTATDDLPIPLTDQTQTKEKTAVPITEPVQVDQPAKIPSDAPAIMVIEDHRDLNHFICELLRPVYQVYSAFNGKEALNILAQHPSIQLFLSDIMMDEMDGYELLKNIKQMPDYYSIPFLFLTAMTGNISEQEGLELGAVDYIKKPFSSQLLMAKIKSLLQQTSTQQDYNLQNFKARLESFLDHDSPEKELVQQKSLTFKDKLLTFIQTTKLTNRESEVTTLLCDGLQYKEIGSQLHISEKTVSTHISRIYEKSGVQNKIELIRLIQG